MTWKRVLIFLGVVAGAAGLYVLIRTLHGGANSEADEQSAPTVVTVQTGRLERATLHGYLEGFGEVMPAPAQEGEPPATTRLASPVAGVITGIRAAEGQKVERGQLLFQLNSRLADVAVEFAQKTLDRQQELLRMNNTSQKAVQDAQQQLAAAQAQQALLRVVAPFSGTVSRVNVSPGEAVDVNTVLAELTDFSRLVIAAQFPVADATQLKPGEPVTVLARRPVTTTISFVSPTADPTNGTILVRAPLPETGAWKPGEYFDLSVVTEEHSNCLVAPAESVVMATNRQEVVAVVADGEATQVPVKAGLRERGRVEIEGQGLKEGEAVVTVGAYGLPPKTKIRIAGR